jgi:hypothetical protein
MKYPIEIALCGMICIPSFMKIGTGVQEILRFCLRNLRGCNAGISDGGDFLTNHLDGLKWCDISTKFHKDWFRQSKVNGGDTRTHTQTAS